MFDENAVHGRTGRQQIGKIWQFLDDNDAVVHRRLEQSCGGIRNQHSYHHGNDVRDLASHFERDHSDAHCVCDSA